MGAVRHRFFSGHRFPGADGGVYRPLRPLVPPDLFRRADIVRGDCPHSQQHYRRRRRISVRAVAAGSVLVFALARALGRQFAEQFVSEKLSERYLDLIRRKRDIFLLLAFLLPFFPDDILCILAGLTDISFRRFFLLVLAARPWGLLVSCMVGSATLSIPLWSMALLGIAGLTVFLLAMKYGDRVEQAVIDRLKQS